METRNALSNLKNRYKAVLRKCFILNTLGSLTLFSLLSLAASATTPSVAHASLNDALLSVEETSSYTLDKEEVVSADLPSLGGGGTSLKNFSIIGNNFSIRSQSENSGISIAQEHTLSVSNVSNWSGFYSHSSGGVFNNNGTINLNYSLFSNNHARASSGVLYNTGIANISFSTFNDNYAAGTYGYTTGGAIYNTGTLKILDSAFNNNIGSQGGAIFNDASLNVERSSFTANKSQHGSAIANDVNGVLTVTDSTFTNNSRREDNILSGYAYGTISNKGTATITNSTFTGNEMGAGGALYNTGTMTVRDSTFTNNTSRTGGAIATDGYDSTLKIYNSKFNANSGGYNGSAAIRSTNSNVFIYDSVFENHYEVNTTLVPGDSYYDRENGGVIYHYDPGYARDEEGNITGFLDTPGVLYIEDTIFRNNTVGRGGGAIYSAGQAILENVTFENNSSDLTHGPAGTAGAFYNYNRLGYFFDDKNSVIRNSTFKNNSAYSAGAIYHAIGTLEVYDTLFDGNKGIIGGIAGALYASANSTLLVHDTDFINNYSGLGAAIGSGRAHIEVYDSYFENNSAEYTGSAIHIRNTTPSENDEVQIGKLIVDNSTFKKNSAPTGTIYLENNIESEFTNIDFLENMGGGIVNYGTSTVSDSLFSKNYDGAAIRNRGDGNVTISNSTFEYGNNSSVSNSGYMEIYNSEFIGNIVSFPEQNYVYSGAFNNVQDGTGAVVKNTVFLNNITQHSNALQQYQGGAIYSRADLDIVADGGDVLFSGNLSNDTPNAIVSSNANLNFYADDLSSFVVDDSILLRVDSVLNINNTANTKSYATNGTIEINDLVLGQGSYLDRFNVNLYDGTLKLGTATTMYDIDADGTVETEISSSGTFASNINFNVYGGTLSTVDSTLQNTNLGNLNLVSSVDWNLDVDLKEEKADMLTANSVVDSQNNILINNINLIALSDKGNEAESNVQITNDRDLYNVIKLGTGRFTLDAGILAEASDFTAVSYDNTNGYLNILTSIEEIINLNTTVADTKSDKAYIMQADENVVENLGKLQGSRLNITGNNNSIIAKDSSGIIVSQNQELAVFDIKNWSGFSGENGAAINNSGLVNIENVNFSDNSAQVAGAAIYNTNSGIVNLRAENQDLIFSNNNIISANGTKSEAIYNAGTINLYSSSDNAVITYDTFAGNGIYNLYNALNFKGSNAQVSENATLNIASSNASISSLDNAIGITSLGKLQADMGFKLFVDVKLDLDNPENTVYDQFTLSGLGNNSNFTLGNINLLDFTQGQADTSNVLDFFIGENSDALALNSSNINNLTVYGSDYEITYSSNEETQNDLNDILYHYDLYSDPGIVNTLNSVLSETTTPRQYIMEASEDALIATVVGDMTVLGNTNEITAGTISLANSANNSLTLNNTNTASGTIINLLATKQANKNTLNIIASENEVIVNNSNIIGKARKHSAVNIYGDGEHVFNGVFEKTTLNLATKASFTGNMLATSVNVLDGNYSAYFDNISLDDAVILNLYGADISKVNTLTIHSAGNNLITSADINSANSDNILNLTGLGTHEIRSNLSDITLNADAQTLFKGKLSNTIIDATKTLTFNNVTLDKSVSINTNDNIEISATNKLTTKAYFIGSNSATDTLDNTVSLSGSGQHILNGATFTDINLDVETKTQIKSATFDNSQIALLNGADLSNTGSMIGGSLLANAKSQITVAKNASFSDSTNIAMKADSILNTRNNSIDTITLNDFTAEEGSKLKLDIDISKGTVDSFKVNSSTGKIKLDSVRLLGEINPEAHKTGTLQIFDPSSLDIDLKKITYYTPLQKVIITQNSTNNGSIDYNADYRSESSIAAALLDAARDSHIIYELVGSEVFNTVTDKLEGALTILGKGQTLTGEGYTGADGSEVNFEDVGTVDLDEIKLGSNEHESSNVTFENTDERTTTVINSNILSQAVSNVVTFGKGIFKTFGLFDPLTVNILQGSTVYRGEVDSVVTSNIQGNLIYTQDRFLYDPALVGTQVGGALYGLNTLNFMGGSLNMINDVATPNMKLASLSLADNTSSRISLDADLANKKMDSFDPTTTTVGANAKLIVDTLNIANEGGDSSVTINFTNNTALQNAIDVSSMQTVGYSPIYEYLISYNAGNFTFNRNAENYNPLVLTSIIGANAFANTAIDNAKRALNPNNVSIVGMSGGSEAKNSLFESAWIDIYGSLENSTFEGFDVDTEQYGFTGGINTRNIELGAWNSAYSFYIGSTNSKQEYKDIDIEQHGFVLGATAAFSKNNFFTKTTANFGMSHNDVNTYSGDENYNSISLSVFNKTGMTFESESGFIALEPSLTLGYSYINSSDYTNVSNVSIESDAWHVLTLNPEIKATLNFSPSISAYAAAGYNFNFDSGGDVKANEIKLPELAADQYAEFKLGVDANISSSFNSYAEIKATAGDRESVSGQIGFKYSF